ncbi:MAG: hypothetical protein HC810_00930 [Acaryochloridaceae cyanobacterium RL_2_7]|nr:hypothetical protein [Acaryochloridaceae cyanobacterium RL_2_7]
MLRIVPLTMQANTSQQSMTVLERPSLDERLMASVKAYYDSSQQEAFLTLESQLNDLAQHIQMVSKAS